MANELTHKDPGAELTQAEFITSDGTGHVFESQATGDILYASSATVLSRLAKSATSTQYLANTGTSNVPAWNEVALTTGVSGTLPLGNGGTGATTLTANGALIGNGTSAIASVDMSTKGGLLAGDGSGNPSVLAVGGSNDHVLTVDSGETTGMKWAASSGTTINNNADNRVISGSGSANTLNGESNLTFSTDLSITSGNVVIATAGKGIDFSAQASPGAGATNEVLDRYEEGTFTPTLEDAGLDVDGQTYNAAGTTGHYTRVGNRVWVNFRITMTSLGNLTGGASYVGGLPFANVNTAGHDAGGHVTYYGNAGLTTATQIVLWMYHGWDYFELYSPTSTTTISQMNINNWEDNTLLLGIANYEVT